MFRVTGQAIAVTVTVVLFRPGYLLHYIRLPCYIRYLYELDLCVTHKIYTIHRAHEHYFYRHMTTSFQGYDQTS